MSSQLFCWECRHCDFSPGSPGCGETTPGYEMRLKCAKNKWDASELNDNVNGLGKALLTAGYCNLFERSE